jgi:hypothetical protein
MCGEIPTSRAQDTRETGHPDMEIVAETSALVRGLVSPLIRAHRDPSLRLKNGCVQDDACGLPLRSRPLSGVTWL